MSAPANSLWQEPDQNDSPLIRGRDRNSDNDMDITPMIDITFLLLIFFLVCSTPDQQSAIELAKARHGRGVGEKESVIITLAAGGVDAAPVFLADGRVGTPLPSDLEEQQELIIEAIQAGRRESNKDNVLIKADRNVAHRDVARVIQAASKVEGSKIHLAVMETE